MRKILLFGLIASFGMTAFGQNKAKKATLPGAESISRPVKAMVDWNKSELNPSLVKKKPGNQTLGAINVIPIGQAPNAATCGFGMGNFIWADPNINAVSFSHRSDFQVNGDGSSGWVRMDASTDGGSTWNNNQGPIYQSGNADTPPFGNARFPNSVIVNPSGNTDPNNATLVYFAPTLVGKNGGTGQFGGFSWGASKLDGSAATKHSDWGDSLVSNVRFYRTEDMTVTPNGDVFVVAPKISLAGGNTLDFQDSIYIFKGTVSGGDVSFTRTAKYIQTSLTSTGANVYGEVDIAFAPNGTDGYLLITGHRDYAEVADSVTYFWLYSTSDGGNTWSNNPTSYIDVNTLDAPSKLYGDTILYAPVFEQDLTVDANGNPHILTNIAIAGAQFNVFVGAGFQGVFDVYSEDGGTSWNSQLLGIPMTFRGCFGDCPSGEFRISEDQRPHTSRSWDGSKLFFTWFDTDTNIFGSTDGNLFPDAYAVGYNTTTRLWTKQKNLTAGTAADGLVSFGNVAPYTFTTGTTNMLPIAYQEMSDLSNVILQTQLHYINGASFDDSEFTESTVINVGVEDPIAEAFSVGQNQPNPFSNQTSFELSLKENAQVTVTVYNMLGDVVLNLTPKQLGAGAHLITIDGTSLNSGVYLYSVNADGATVTRKMIVE